MTDHREILRLSSQGLNQRRIALSCDCSRNTVSKVLKRADELGIRWPLKDGMTNAELQETLFAGPAVPPSRGKPDHEHIHRELAKSGVTLSLLWNEYCEESRRLGELPLMYSQFCHHYRELPRRPKPPCTSTANLVNKWRWIGPARGHIFWTQIPVKTCLPTSLSQYSLAAVNGNI